MTRLIVFDFDGTLGDTKENIVKTMQETMRRMHFSVPDEATIASTIGLPLETGFEIMVPGISREKCLECADLYRVVFDEYKAMLKPQPFPEVKETLARLQEQGIMMSVASSRLSLSLDAFVNDMGLGKYISYVLGVDHQIKPKPAPEPVLQCLEHFGVAARDALVVGDMAVDIQMGRSAGAPTCGVTWGNGKRPQLAEAGADFIIDSMEELLPLMSRS
ncbi:MAG: HAD family hydrolase [Bacteroidales bacterium]|nr:HAD family hydrolase [Bacteroidales bacterium]